MYDPDIDRWSMIEPASTARWDGGIAVESDKIYFVGGCNRNAFCTLEIECYDPEKDNWSKVASLPVVMHGIRCCTIQLPHKACTEVNIHEGYDIFIEANCYRSNDNLIGWQKMNNFVV